MKGIGIKEICSYDVGIEMFAPPFGNKHCDRLPRTDVESGEVPVDCHDRVLQIA